MVSDNNNNSVTPIVTPKKKRVTPNRISCNDLTIKNIKPQKKRVDYWFKEHPGFGIRVTPKGTKTFVHVFRFSNKLVKSTIGKYPEINLRQARKKYDEQLEKIEEGINPTIKLKKAKSRRITINEAIKIYERHGITKEKASIQEEIRALNKDLKPEYGNTFIQDMESSDFDDILTSVLKRGSPQMANHLYKYLHRMCEVLRPKYLDTNPVSSLELPATISKKTRVLTFTEIYRLWYALPKASTQLTIQLALKFILVTMQRGKDIRLMEFNEYNAKDRIWTIPNPKNDREWRVPLNKYGIEILEALKMMKPSVDHPFLLDAGNLMGKDTLSKSVEKERTNLEIDHFTPHDLRRTAATLITSLGCPTSWATLMLNHTDNSVTSIYDQYAYDYEKRLAANVLEFALDKILSCKSVDQIPSIDEMRELIKKTKILQR